MINIGDNLGYNGTKPNFTRDSFSTISIMSAINDNNIDDGHLSYCAGTNKHYKFNRNNTIDSTTGKWRLLFSDTLGQAEDVSINLKTITNNFLTINNSIALKLNKLTTGTGIEISNDNIISASVSSYTYAGTVNTVSDLPQSSTIGYFYCVTNDTVANTNYAWNGTNWQSIGNSLYQLANEQRNGLMPYLDKLKINLFSKIEETGFAIVDQDSNIGFKFDENGIDANKISTNLLNLIKEIDGLVLSIGITSGTAYDGLDGNNLKIQVDQLLSSALLLGETESTAYKGSDGKLNKDNISKLLVLINGINLKIGSINQLITETTESGFNIVDENGYSVIRYSLEGFDVESLSSHIIQLIKTAIGSGSGNGSDSRIIETNEDGFFIIDENNNILFSINDSDGINFLLLGDYSKTAILNSGIIPTISIGYTILSSINF